ncbi:MAG: AraC family transcriptional regulator [Gemmatimonadaceae bacterium]|nr:AraC family transcriptional regulator [Gemmatimonadaceae bacterium]
MSHADPLDRGIAVTGARVVSHEHDGEGWLLATRESAPAVRGCVPQYVGYEERSVTPVRRLEVPHPDITVIVNLGAPLDVHAPAIGPRGALFGSFVAGLFDTVAVTGTTGVSCGIEMNLTPIGMWQLLGVPMHEFTNRVVPFDALFGRQAARLEDQLRATPSWDARFDLLDAALTRQLARRVSPPPEVWWAWDQLRCEHRPLPVSTIARELQWSRRRLGAAFREYVGLTPKAFSRVVRFDRAVRRVRDGTLSHWSSLAHECGYADQAHLIREFREFAGIAPTEFLRRNGDGSLGVSAD